MVMVTQRKNIKSVTKLISNFQHFLPSDRGHTAGAGDNPNLVQANPR